MKTGLQLRKDRVVQHERERSPSILWWPPQGPKFPIRTRNSATVIRLGRNSSFGTCPRIPCWPQSPFSPPSSHPPLHLLSWFFLFFGVRSLRNFRDSLGGTIVLQLPDLIPHGVWWWRTRHGQALSPKHQVFHTLPRSLYQWTHFDEKLLRSMLLWEHAFTSVKLSASSRVCVYKVFEQPTPSIDPLSLLSL